MNADVEKAVERVNEGEAVTATPHPDCDALVKLVDLDDWHTIRQALRGMWLRRTPETTATAATCPTPILTASPPTLEPSNE